MSQPVALRSPWYVVERDQAVLYALSALVLAVSAYRYVAPQWTQGRSIQELQPGQRIDYRVNLNTGAAAELDLLPGIGRAKAAQIIAYREAHGPFRRPADLASVPGISRGCIEKLRGLVTPDDPAPAGDTPW